MRSIAAIPTCLALMLGFFLAPFEHVHSAGHEEAEHSAIIHAHLYFHQYEDIAVQSSTSETGVRLSASDDDQAASLNMFTSVVPVAIALLFVPQSSVVNPAPTGNFSKIDFIEERGHDPPLVESSIPRAPPS